MKQTARWMMGLGALLMLVGLSACAPAAKSSGKPQVVASLNFYGEVAKAVAGTHAEVATIITSPTTDPHDFDPPIAAAKKVAKADLVVANGLGYDDWMTRLIDSANPKVRAIQVAASVMKAKPGENEHVWYAPDALAKTAQAIANQLGQLDPTNQSAYQANAKRYVAQLAPLADLRQQISQQKTVANVMVAEPVFDLALEAMGFTVVNHGFAHAMEEGTDPSPVQLSKMQAMLKKRQVAFFVANKQVDSPVIADLIKLAKTSGVPVVTVTEAMPAKVSYLQWQQKQYQAVLAALKR